MHRIKLLKPWSFYSPGAILVRPGGIADLLIRRGIAERIDDIETAMIQHAPIKRKRGRPRKHPVETR